MRVPVLDANKTPLMPTTPTRARLLLKSGKARPYYNKLGVFCIILQYIVAPENQTLVAGIDPGSLFEGWSVVGTTDTVLNGMSEAPTHVKKAMKTRKMMRGARRYRNCWRREARFKNRARNKTPLPPSTRARWDAKLRILLHLKSVIPISTVVVEDVSAASIKNCRKWNICFSPIEIGKMWFYQKIKSICKDLVIKRGYETKTLRGLFGLKKTSSKKKRVFSSHAVDAWVMAASVSGAPKPTEFGLHYWIPIKLFRRQLHMLQPILGGARRLQGGTRSLGLTRGTLIRHPEYGLAYIGGVPKNRKMQHRISLHSCVDGKRITRHAKKEDLKILTRVAWRTQFVSGSFGACA